MSMSASTVHSLLQAVINSSNVPAQPMGLQIRAMKCTHSKKGFQLAPEMGN